ncbi:DinB family protein [Micromonospora citrea]|uniref:DinB family protein n=1 Tax=Micromonospora citrea TaxID=47855 RepID=UPI003C32B3A9
MTIEFPSPTVPAAGRTEVFLRYLDYFRESVVAKVTALSEDDVRRSRLPSGWTPLELVKHLRYVELRWIEWGFQGRDVGDPWGDRRDDRWHVAPEETRADLLAALRAQGGHTRAVVEGSDLAAIGAPGERWDGADPASLERVLFHLVQEYARHVGHLDIVAELAGGPTGE